MKDCTVISIGGYRALIDKKGYIIEIDPVLKDFMGKNIRNIFKSYRHRTFFTRRYKTEFPMIVSDDIYKVLVGKNAAIEKLKNKFNCEIF